MWILLLVFPSLLSALSMGLLRHNIKAMSLASKISSAFTLLVALYACYSMNTLPGDVFANSWSYEIPILTQIGASLSLTLTGVSALLAALTAVAFTVVAFMDMPSSVEPSRAFIYHGLLQALQFALLGVYTTNDAFFFYCFWEFTLLPIYFLSSLFGGKNSIKAAFSFFIYTFTASLLMLVGLIAIYSYTNARSFSLYAFMDNNWGESNPIRGIIGWMMFIGFAVKTPLFPFHAWQSKLYKQSPTPLTIILSSVVAKMGLFGIFRWLLPVLPSVSTGAVYASIIVLLSCFGALYGAMIAFKQKDIKTLLAYSSLSHLGLMGAALFTGSIDGIQGSMLQLISHGIANVGLWLIVYHIEKIYGHTTIKDASGLIRVSPVLSFFLIAFSLANIAFPLTANFVGEWMMFVGIVHAPFLSLAVKIAAIALSGISLILGSVYTLPMIKTVVYGKDRQLSSYRLSASQTAIFALLFFIILSIGVYPAFFLDMLGEEAKMVVETIQTSLF